jgi:EAL domain-containing protein (putative c-di-GMP-specific phosphodiesterase class I)
VQIKEKDFVSDIVNVLDEFPDDTSGLELEITETLIMENLKDNIKKLVELRNRGVQISIDDFGTGYSSLSYMSRLPVNTLKIDRAFINVMLDNPDDTSIVSAIISLAHSLSLYVVAEGVETLEQANLLKLLRCDQFQGYLFSPPVPPLDIESMLSEHKSFV